MIKSEQFIYYDQLNLLIRSKLDPLLSFLMELLNFEIDSPQLKFLAFIIQFSLWSSFFLSLPAYRQTAISRAFILVCGLFLLFSNDITQILSPWFPVVCLGLCLLRKGQFMLGILVFLSSALLWFRSAGELIFIGSVLVIIIAHLLIPQGSKKNYPAIFILELFLLAMSIFYLPQPLAFDYPSTARLTSISALTFDTAAFFGPFIYPNTMLLSAIAEAANYHTWSALIVFLALAGVLYFPRLEKQLLFIALIPILLILDAWLLEQRYEWSMYATLKRTVPGFGAGVFPWAILNLVWTLTLIFIHSESLTRKRILIGIFAGLLIVDNLILANNPATKLPYQSTVFQAKVDAIALEYSPSAYIVSELGEWTKQQRRYVQILDTGEGISSFEVSSNTNQQQLSFAIDRDINSKWSTARAQQSGDYFQIIFPESAEVVQIQLITGRASADFPRGFKLEVLAEVGDNWQLVQQYDDWLGPVYWSPQGYPYLGSQDDVRIDLPEQLKLRGLRITLVTDSIYDWSIAEVKLMALKN